MKNAILFLSMLTIGLVSCSKDDDVKITETPEAVQTAFNAKFSGATQVETERDGDLYEFDFKLNGVDYEAQYKSDGNLVKFKHDLALSTIPTAIQTKINADYEGKTVDEVEMLTIGSATYYQVEINNEPNDIKLVFNADGSLNQSVTYWD
ncbi:PepSY-like domain-containing protein [Pelobium manganitolerans]|nr:PepSY-like domain-containing protein [Pelobium manganitolerans]